jgi:hypothetical protein
MNHLVPPASGCGWMGTICGGQQGSAGVHRRWRQCGSRNCVSEMRRNKNKISSSLLKQYPGRDGCWAIGPVRWAAAQLACFSFSVSFYFPFPTWVLLFEFESCFRYFQFGILLNKASVVIV